MTESLVDKLTSIAFKSDVYVKYVTRNALGVDDLVSTKQKIQFLSDETNGSLKKNVYQNYMQFIETAKEISYLESEMYQLSHMLTEQQSVISALLDFSVIGTKNTTSSERQEKKDEDGNKNLSTLLEKVEGCASVLDVRGCNLVHCGEVMEISPNEAQKLKKMYIVLLNDSLMLASALINRRGPVQYKFQDLYELDNLAVVNVLDDHQHKNAFRVLMFPDTRLFQCETSQAKKEWLEIIDKLKKEKITPTSIRRESFIEAKNPFLDDRSSVRSYNDNSMEDYRNQEDDVPELLLELPEELDVHIAQRDFEGAVELVHKANNPKYTLSKEMRSRIDHRVKLLVDVLMNELRVAPDKSLQGGPRVARRAVHLLILLGKSSQACSLFLKHRSAILRQSMKHQKVEGATTPYVNRLCTVFFNNMVDTGREFTRAFTNSNSCASAFVIWAQSELLRFLRIFSRHVFTVQVNISTVAECVYVIRNRCQQLFDIGLDLAFVVDNFLKRDIENVIIESKGKLVEAVKLRASEDKWKPQNLQNKAGVGRIMEDMMDIGISGIVSYIYDDFYLSLSANTTSFCKAYLTFVDDLMKVYTPEAQILILGSIVETLNAQMRHVEASLVNEKFVSEKKFIRSNAKFLIDVLLPLVEQRYEKKTSDSTPTFAEIKQKYSEITNTTTVRGSVTKYSSSAYL